MGTRERRGRCRNQTSNDRKGRSAIKKQEKMHLHALPKYEFLMILKKVSSFQ
jgi:hypothetical protein